MKQYCRYCSYCISGDCYYCTLLDNVLTDSGIKRENHCPHFHLSSAGDVDTGKQYRPHATVKCVCDYTEIPLIKEDENNA